MIRNIQRDVPTLESELTEEEGLSDEGLLACHVSTLSSLELVHNPSGDLALRRLRSLGASSKNSKLREDGEGEAREKK